MNRNNKIGIIAASAAVVLFIVSMWASNQGMTTSEGPREIAIDFSVYPENRPDPIIVERGVAKSIPLKVEAPNDAEITLQLELAFGLDTVDPAQLDAELSQTTVVLSKTDLEEGKVTNLSSSRGIRDAGVLTLNPSPSMQPGEYLLMLEARQQITGELGSAAVSGALIYVTVK